MRLREQPTETDAVSKAIHSKRDKGIDDPARRFASTASRSRRVACSRSFASSMSARASRSRTTKTVVSTMETPRLTNAICRIVPGSVSHAVQPQSKTAEAIEKPAATPTIGTKA